MCTNPETPSPAHCGAVSARLEPQPGKPPSGSATTAPTTAELQALFATRQGRILLAEDDFVCQMVALMMLKRLGLQADAVASGVAVLQALECHPYDLVLMDVQMPEMDGLSATRLIRSPESGVRDHRVPIIAMTAHAMPGDVERCLEAGMNDYLGKPVRPGALADMLLKWLPSGNGPGL